jgi:hypothetical protein
MLQNFFTDICMVLAHFEDLHLAVDTRSGVSMLVFVDHLHSVFLSSCQIDGRFHACIGTRTQMVIN